MQAFQKIIMCDELPDGAEVTSGMFFDDVNTSALQRLGLDLTEGRNLHYDNGVIIFLSIAAVLLTICCMLTNYLINIDKLRKRHAVQFLSGVTYRRIFVAEIIKTIGIFLIAMVLNVVANVFLKSDSFNGVGLTSTQTTWQANGLTALFYIVTMGIGTFKLFKVKPLEAVNAELES